MKALGESIAVGEVKVTIWGETEVVEFGGRGEPECKHEVVALWDSNGHNFLNIIGYYHPDELQIVVDLMNNYAPIVYAARDILEARSGGTSLGKLFDALEIAVNGKPNMEEEDGEEEYTLDEILFDL